MGKTTLTAKEMRKKKEKIRLTKEELKELEALEDKEGL